MKKLLIKTFLLLGTYAYADTIEWKNKPVKCAPAHKVVETMQSKGEHPIIWMDGFAQLPDKIA